MISPALLGLDRRAAGADLAPTEGALLLAISSVGCPELQIRGLGYPDLPEGVRPLQGGVQAVHLLRKQHGVAEAGAGDETLPLEAAHILRGHVAHARVGAMATEGHV